MKKLKLTKGEIQLAKNSVQIPITLNKKQSKTMLWRSIQ